MTITERQAFNLFIIFPLMLMGFAFLMAFSMKIWLDILLKSKFNKAPIVKFVEQLIALCDFVFVIFSHPFVGWFARVVTTSLASYGASEKLYEVIMAKPFYTPIDVLALLTAFMLWVYIVVVLIQAFYPFWNISEWVVIGCFSMFVGASYLHYLTPSQTLNNVFAFCIVMSIFNSIRIIVLNQSVPDEKGDPKILKPLTVITDKLFKPFYRTPKATNG